MLEWQKHNAVPHLCFSVLLILLISIQLEQFNKKRKQYYNQVHDWISIWKGITGKKNGRGLVPGNFNNSWRSSFGYFYLHALNISYQNIPQNDAIESLILKALAVFCQIYLQVMLFISWRFTDIQIVLNMWVLINTCLYLFLSALDANHKLEVLV